VPERDANDLAWDQNTVQSVVRHADGKQQYLGVPPLAAPLTGTGGQGGTQGKQLRVGLRITAAPPLGPDNDVTIPLAHVDVSDSVPPAHEHHKDEPLLVMFKSLTLRLNGQDYSLELPPPGEMVDLTQGIYLVPHVTPPPVAGVIGPVLDLTIAAPGTTPPSDPATNDTNG
jgi:hypothetical protein